MQFRLIEFHIRMFRCNRAQMSAQMPFLNGISNNNPDKQTKRNKNENVCRTTKYEDISNVRTHYRFELSYVISLCKNAFVVQLIVWVNYAWITRYQYPLRVRYSRTMSVTGGRGAAGGAERRHRLRVHGPRAHHARERAGRRRGV